ncbi:MAG: hypothetical protein J3Q66DRAFT_384755 [Benniella sp.]|nr:MAG: hypothetical protein J3Q66DRAFT_384755 [Benniella sp.]
MSALPLCFASDGVSLYTALIGYDLSDTTKRPGRPYYAPPELVLARSNPYPSFSNLTWTVVTKVERFSKTLANLHYNYLCGWNPTNSSLAISARPPDFYYPSYDVELPANGQTVSVIETTDSKEQYANEQGRSLLLHTASYGGDPNHPWIRIRFDKQANQLVFTYFGKGMAIAGEPQVRWDMDVTTTGTDLILTHSNNTLYALGLMNSTSNPRSYVMSVIPLDTTTTPLTRPSIINTMKTTIEDDCEMGDSQTSMHTDKDTVYILCSVSRMAGKPAFELYRFNGKSTEHLGQMPTDDGITFSSSFYQWIPVPKNGSASTWAYISSLERRVYGINYTEINSDYLKNGGKFFTSPRYLSTYEAGGDSWVEDDPFPAADSDFGIPKFIPIVIGCIAAIVVITLLSRLFRRRSPRPTGPIPLTTISPGVHREVHGEDASDELPKYEIQSTTDQTPQPLVRHDTTSEPPGYSVSPPTNPTFVTADDTAGATVTAAAATGTTTVDSSAPNDQSSTPAQN